MFTIANRRASRIDVHESRLAHLTDVVYQVALKHGFQGSFLELQLDLWNTLRRELERTTGAEEPAPALSSSSLYFVPVRERQAVDV